MSNIVLTWEDVEQCIQRIAGQLKDDGYTPLTIVGVAKGGVIPATLLHQTYEEAIFETIQVKSYGNELIPKKPEIVGNYTIRNHPSTLIVDDIIDSGQTAVFLKKHFPDATYAFMTCRNTQARNCLYRGNIYGSGWIEFPWEKKLPPIEIPC